jgi:hypothetical protein
VLLELGADVDFEDAASLMALYNDALMWGPTTAGRAQRILMGGCRRPFGHCGSHFGCGFNTDGCLLAGTPTL